MTTFYTAFSANDADPNLAQTGLSLAEAARELLRADNHDYAIRQDDE